MDFPSTIKSALKFLLIILPNNEPAGRSGIVIENCGGDIFLQKFKNTTCFISRLDCVKARNSHYIVALRNCCSLHDAGTFAEIRMLLRKTLEWQDTLVESGAEEEDCLSLSSLPANCVVASSLILCFCPRCLSSSSK